MHSNANADNTWNLNEVTFYNMQTVVQNVSTVFPAGHQDSQMPATPTDISLSIEYRKCQ